MTTQVDDVQEIRNIKSRTLIGWLGLNCTVPVKD